MKDHDCVYDTSPHHLPPETILAGRYRIERVIGEGGFGITYRGYDLKLERKVAIKEYFPVDKAARHSPTSLDVINYTGAAAEKYELGKRKYISEARLMAQMEKRPEIVGIQDYFEENNTAYLVMEYVEGITLKELAVLRGGRIPAAELLALTEPLFSALGYLHEKGIIHRDISPGNLMLENGRLRLLDFGCARESLSGTETVTVSLKHGYAPIEQYQHNGQGPWTDVYGLCATLYYCLTGKTPVPALDRICEDTLPWPGKLGADITKEQEMALSRGMEVRPRRRFQSIQELYTALYADRLQTGQEQTAEETRILPEHRGRPKRHIRHFIRGCAAAVLLLAVCAVWALTDRTTPQAIQKEPPAMADSAVFLSEDTVRIFEADEALLRETLAGDAPAVIWDKAQSIQITGEPLVLTKPLFIGENTYVENASYLLIEDGGLLQVKGSLSNYGLIRVRGNGRLQIADGGELEGPVSIWLESEQNFVVDEGGKTDICGMAFSDAGYDNMWYMTVPEQELSEDAAHVATEKELIAAQKGNTVSTIVIEKDMALTNASGYCRQNLLIKEGVTLTASPKNHAALFFEGDFLINYGSIEGEIRTGNRQDNDLPHHILNYGSMAGELFLESEGNFINMGTAALSGGKVLLGNVYNIGSLLYDGRSGQTFLDFQNRLFLNVGTFCLKQPDNPGDFAVNVQFLPGVTVHNQGLIEIGEACGLIQDSEVRGYGRMTAAPASRLWNRGRIWLMRAPSAHKAAGLMVSEEASFENTGFICHSAHSTLSFPGTAADYSGVFLPFGWGDEPENARWVFNREEMEAALADTDCDVVILEAGSEITWDSDLVVTKGLAVPDSASLKITDGNLVISGEKAFFYNDEAALRLPGSITVEEHASAYIYCLSECEDIRLKSGGKLFCSKGKQP